MKYTLAFACSQDGFIAKHSKDNPFEWTSREDQNHLQTLINDNEWQVMGRTTHELNPNESRKRIVFSRQFREIKQIKENILNQYYFNPDLHQWSEFEKICSENILILGGTSVHDFFIYAELVDTIHITIEPYTFNEGVRAFSYINFKDYEPYFLSKNYSFEKKILNNKGTTLMSFNKNS